MQVARRRIEGQYRPTFGLRCRCRAGCRRTGYYEEKKQAPLHTNIPLVGVKAVATITDVACEVTLVQRYRNDEEVPLEVGYSFPLDSRAAVCRFEVELDGKRVVGKVMPNAEARDTYDDAIAEGSGAYLLEQKKEEIFQMNVGNLPPGKECTIHITYVVELPLEGEMVRFTLPTTIAPRYHGQGTTAKDLDALKEVTSIPAGPSSSSGSIPYGLELDIAIEMPSPVLSVESPSHPIRFSLDPDSPTKGRVTLAAQETALDRDFVLMIQQKDAHRPGLWVDNERQAVLLALYPRFAEIEQKREFIFLLDRSGSMAGSSIENAKSALQLFLRSLPEGCRFNIVGFGSSYQSLFKRSMDYSDRSLQEASRSVERMQADLGGTEILSPMKDILEDHTDPEYSRQVFVLTDGEVGNTDAILRLIRGRTAMKMADEVTHALEKGVCTWNGNRHFVEQHWYHCKTCYGSDPLSGCCLVCKEVCHKDHDLVPRYGAFFCDCGSNRDHRCRALRQEEGRQPIPVPPLVQIRVFTLGIGAAASRELVLGMAKAGKGTAEFVVPGERIESKVMRQLRLAMQPSVDDVTCDWGASWGAVLTQAPEVPPPLFDGNRLCIFGLVNENAVLPQDATEPVKVSYTSPGSAAREKEVHAFLPYEAVVASTSVVRTLAAKHRISELSEKEVDAFRSEKDRFKAQIEALGVKYQLATAHTSFVAKDEREEATEGTMQRRIVPSYNAAAYGYSSGSHYSGYRGRGGSRGGRGGSRGGRGGGGYSGYGGKGFMFSESASSTQSKDRDRDRARSRSRSRSPPPAYAQYAFSAGSPPINYLSGMGRGAQDFSTRSDIGPVPVCNRRPAPIQITAEQIIRECAVSKKKKRARESDRTEEFRKEEAEDEDEVEEEMERELVVDKNSHERLAKLVMLQRANGSFELDDKLAQLLGVTLADLNAQLRSLTAGGGDNDKRQVWATALALAYLETRLQTIADDWAMMADKSRRWLRRETDSDPASVPWLSEAKKALASQPSA